MLRQFLAICLFSVSVCSGQIVQPPFNPDANQDNAIGAPDLLEFLPLFGGFFTPEPILIDGQTLEAYIEQLENALEEAESDTLQFPFLSGGQPGEMLVWNGQSWTILANGTPGDILFYGETGPEWTDLLSILAVEGCMDPSACNYDPLAVFDDGSCDFRLIQDITLGGGQEFGPVSFYANMDIVESIGFSLTFAGAGDVFVTDLAMLLSAPNGRCVNIGGFDLSFDGCAEESFIPVNFNWPFPSNGGESGTYTGDVDLSTGELGGDGLWTVTIMNGYSNTNQSGTWSLQVNGFTGFQCQ